MASFNGVRLLLIFSSQGCLCYNINNNNKKKCTCVWTQLQESKIHSADMLQFDYFLSLQAYPATTNPTCLGQMCHLQWHVPFENLRVLREPKTAECDRECAGWGNEPEASHGLPSVQTSWLRLSASLLDLNKRASILVKAPELTLHKILSPLSNWKATSLALSVSLVMHHKSPSRSHDKPACRFCR